MRANYRTHAKGGIKQVKSAFEPVAVGGCFGRCGARRGGGRVAVPVWQVADNKGVVCVGGAASETRRRGKAGDPGARNALHGRQARGVRQFFGIPMRRQRSRQVADESRFRCGVQAADPVIF